MVAWLSSGLLWAAGGILTLLFVMYMTVYSVEIIRETAGGEQEAPDWPDLTSLWDDLLRPCLLVLGTGVLCYFPAGVWEVLQGGTAGFDPISLLLTLAGAVYYPMALLAVVMSDSIVGVNPVTVIGGIAKTGRDYVIVCVVMFALAASPDWSGWLIGSVPLIGTLLGGMVVMYLLMFESHLLGSLYHANRKRLGWFEDAGRATEVTAKGGAGEAQGGADPVSRAEGATAGPGTGEAKGEKIIDLSDIAEELSGPAEGERGGS